MKITVHCLVRNEDIWVGFALKAVLPFAEKIFVFDNGPSLDKTIKVVQAIKSSKIVLEEKGPTNRAGLAALRQEMIARTKTEWFLVVDADEIWPQDQLKKLLETAENASKNIVGLVNYTRNCVGDIYHYLPESFGGYQIAGRRGNLTIRLIKTTPTMYMGGEYPLETWMDKNGPIQSQDKNLLVTDLWYLHTSYLQRSSSVAQKFSGSFGKQKFWEKGIKLPNNELPEVLQSGSIKEEIGVLRKRGLAYESVAAITTPLLQLKRKIKT